MLLLYFLCYMPVPGLDLVACAGRPLLFVYCAGYKIHLRGNVNHFQYCTQGRKDLVTLEIFFVCTWIASIAHKDFQFTMLSFDGPCNNKLTHVS